MRQFLQLAAQYPDQIAIALHEYSYTVDDIADAYPYKVGRFQELFAVADAYFIPRPTVLITEWGWEYNHVPAPEQALADITWASWLYAAHPEVLGAAIWYLGKGEAFDPVAQETQLLVEPVTDYSLSHYFGISPEPGRIEPAILAPANMVELAPERFRHASRSR